MKKPTLEDEQLADLVKHVGWGIYIHQTEEAYGQAALSILSLNPQKPGFLADYAFYQGAMTQAKATLMIDEEYKKFGVEEAAPVVERMHVRLVNLLKRLLGGK